MGWGNPVVGSTILRRPAIQSPGFVSGSTGWVVAADGSAEFNNVQIRGSSTIGPTTGQRIVIDSAAGTITMYDAGNNVTGQWSAPAQTFRLVSGVAKLLLQSGSLGVFQQGIYVNPDTVNLSDGVITWIKNVLTNQAQLSIGSPFFTSGPGATQAAVTFSSSSSDGLLPASAAFSGDVQVGADLLLNNGGTVYRNQISSTTTVANTVTETVVASMPVPANDNQVGGVYRIRAWGILSTTGSPTCQWTAKYGGLSIGTTGALAAGVAGFSSKEWLIDACVSVLAIGASGSLHGWMQFPNTYASGATGPTSTGVTSIIDHVTVTRDTTINHTFDIATKWGTANALNTLTCSGFSAERVA